MLLETMKRFNEACNHIAETVLALQSANKVEIHKTVYYPVREHFGLSSQLTVRAISKVCEAYKRDRSSELPCPEGRGFPLHRQNLHHRYVM